VSQALVFGDKRPYCVALLTFSEEATKRYGAGAADSPELKAALQKAVDEVNGKLAPFERVKRFCILPQDLTEAAGELTPKLSVKRKVVIDKYRQAIEALYEGGSAAHAD
jgi:long-chain acyl-CoA synthetase